MFTNAKVLIKFESQLAKRKKIEDFLKKNEDFLKKNEDFLKKNEDFLKKNFLKAFL